MRSLTLNCNTHSQLDVGIIQLSKILPKTKLNIQLFLHCLCDLVIAHPENLSTLPRIQSSTSLVTPGIL